MALKSQTTKDNSSRVVLDTSATRPVRVRLRENMELSKPIALNASSGSSTRAELWSKTTASNSHTSATGRKGSGHAAPADSTAASMQAKLRINISEPVDASVSAKVAEPKHARDRTGVERSDLLKLGIGTEGSVLQGLFSEAEAPKAEPAGTSKVGPSLDALGADTNTSKQAKLLKNAEGPRCANPNASSSSSR